MIFGDFVVKKEITVSAKTLELALKMAAEELGAPSVEALEYTVLEKVLGELSPNDMVLVTIYRNGRYYTSKITIGSNNQVE